MEPTAAFAGLECADCGECYPPDEILGRCPGCAGPLTARYDPDTVIEFMPDTLGARGDLWQFAALLPFSPARAVSLGEGGTPLVECPHLADELDVARVLIKDEGANPTGSLADRAMSLAVTAAHQTAPAAVGLPSAGNDGHAAAAYAARAGLDAHVYVPSRAGFVQKAMINVHGGDMTVVEGRLADATTAWTDALATQTGLTSLAPADTPYRVEGVKTVLYEVVAALGTAPDAVVVPTGTGLTITAIAKAVTELAALDWLEPEPRLYATQATGCAPITAAVEADASVEPWPHPDTICADLEVSDPPAGDAAVEAIRSSDGGAVATDDAAILESAVTVADTEGVDLSPAGGAAASGAWTLAEQDTFASDDVLVLLNPAAGAKTPDVLRSHLMGQGL